MPKWKVEIVLNGPNFWTDKDFVVRFMNKFCTSEDMKSLKVSAVEEEEIVLKGV